MKRRKKTKIEKEVDEFVFELLLDFNLYKYFKKIFKKNGK